MKKNIYCILLVLLILLISIFFKKQIENMNINPDLLDKVNLLKKEKQKFLTSSKEVNKLHPYLVKDKQAIYFSKYKCLDYEDLKVN